MQARLRRAAIRALTAVPAYRALPPGSARTYAAVRYHAQQKADSAICELLEDRRPDPLRHYSSAMIAARSAIRTGKDDLAEELLAATMRRFPDAAGPHVLAADLDIFHADFAGAAAQAGQAQLLDPGDEAATVRAVRLAYVLDGAEAGDEAAVSAIRRFPRSAGVQWAACKECRSVEQFDRIMRGWLDAVEPFDDPERLEPRFAHFATAAARGGLLDAAVDLYAQAILLRLDGVNATRVVREKQLAGKGAWSAILDVCEVLGGARIPYFFAAGTALGLVRAGRPLGHDSDIDVGVFERDWDHQALVELFLKHPRFDIDVAHPQHDKIYLKHRGGSSLDIWQFFEDGGKVWHAGLLTKWWNTPFTVSDLTLRGHSIPVPEDADRYLTECYGDWRTPNPDFDAFIDAPNVEVTWPEYLDFHRLRRAYRYLSASKVRQAVRQLTHAQDALAHTPAGARVLRAIGSRLDGQGTVQPVSNSGPHDRSAKTIEADAVTVARALDAATSVLERTGGFLIDRDPTPAAAVAIELARHARGTGSRDGAIRILTGCLRGGGWLYARLWSELVTLMETPDDYLAIRDLWLSNPRHRAASPLVLRAVARGACVAGHHDEGRALLRKAILAQVKKNRQRRTPAGVRTLVVRRLRARPDRDQGEAPSFQDLATTAMVDLNAVLADLDLRPFLLGGTLLGFVREGNFIPYDKDVDVGIVAPDLDPAVLERAFSEHEAFAVRRLDLTSDRLRVNHVNGVMIDVFPHYEEDGLWWHDGAATRWWNTPFELKPVEFLGVRQYVPENPEAYLEESYGDWRTPQPDFEARLDKPNVDVTDPPYLDSLAYFSLLDAIIKGNRTKKQRFVDILRGLGEGDWLDRL